MIIVIANININGPVDVNIASIRAQNVRGCPDCTYSISVVAKIILRLNVEYPTI
jgi:hypothetical protein